LGDITITPRDKAEVFPVMGDAARAAILHPIGKVLEIPSARIVKYIKRAIAKQAVKIVPAS